MARTQLSLSEARRMALAAQGFDRPRPRGPVGPARVAAAIHGLGLLQIDYVNILVPAQYQVLFSRLGPYDRGHLDRLVHRRRAFTEQWAHEASIIPMDAWPLLRHRMAPNARRARAFAAFLKKHREHADHLVELIRARGPLTAAELPEPDGKPRKRGEWWGWSLSKTTLEACFATGRLAIADRRAHGFARAYDLAERVIPEEHHRREIAADEAQRELLRRSARAHGLGTARDLADYYRVPIVEARPRLAELAEAGELVEARVEGWREAAFVHPKARLPARVGASALLSPFDPVVWFRPRAARLFGFDYRIEIYTPAERRRWGYYVLPFLLGERLVARVDLKADRAAERLRVLAAHLEEHSRHEEVAPPLAAELHRMARWLGLRGVRVERRGNLARSLAACVRAHRAEG